MAASDDDQWDILAGFESHLAVLKGPQVSRLPWPLSLSLSALARGTQFACPAHECNCVSLYVGASPCTLESFGDMLTVKYSWD